MGIDRIIYSKRKQYRDLDQSFIQKKWKIPFNISGEKSEQAGGEIPKYYKEVIGLINNKYKPGSFKLTKYDEANQGKKLPNATFTLTDENGKTIYRTSNTNGEVDFTNIAPGRYSLEETKAPDGYRLTNKKWQVTVLSDGSVRIRETSITGESKLYTNAVVPIDIQVANKPSGQKFRVYKKDGNGQPLPGAKFKITDPKDSTFSAEATSGPKGIVEFKETLEEGKNYILQEVTPPTGYNPLNKKWVLRVEDGKTKVYNYSKSTEIGDVEKSLLGDKDTQWVDVKGRNTSGWSNYDNRWTGWVANSQDAEHLGTRIIAINKEKKYIVQRYIINPEAKNIDAVTTATIHREKPEYPNMDWYKGDEEIKIFTLGPKEGGNTDGKVTGLISDIRLASYKVTDITNEVKKSTDTSHHGETRLKLNLPATDKPILVDVKVPYKDENGGVGTGMDWREGDITYWKSDYYERVSDIKTAGLVSETGGTIVGSYVAEDSLDVTNDLKTYDFKIKKVKDDNKTVIPGAVFKLTGPDSRKDERFETTDKDGMLSFSRLEPGKYTLEEFKPAPGYEKANTTWTVRVTNDGRVYIKENAKTSTEANANADSSTNLAMESNAKLTIVQAIPGDTSNVNTELAMKMQTIKASTYNFTNESVGNSPLFLNEADKRENSVINKINAIYGENNFEKLFPNGITIREVAIAAYDSEVAGLQNDEATSNADGLEISPEEVPEAQRAESEYTIEGTGKTTYGKTDVTTDVIYEGNNQFLVKINVTRVGENIKNAKFIVQLNDYFDFVAGSTTTWRGSINNAQTTRWHSGYNPNTKIIEIYADQLTLRGGTAGIQFRVTANSNLPGGKATKIINDIPFKASDRATEYTISVPTVTKQVQTYSVNTSSQGNGTVTASPNQNVEVGKQVNVTVNPENSYELDKLIIDGQDVTQSVNNNQYNFAMPGHNVNVEASFKEKTYNVYTQTPVGGKLSVNKTSAKANETITVTAVANDDYELKSITYTDTAGIEHTVTGNSFTMPASDVTVRATFEKKEDPNPDFKVNVNPAENGQVTATPTSAKKGETVTITASPSEGFVLDTLTVTDGSGNPVQVTNNSFTMPESNVTVSATFKKAETPDQPSEGETEIKPGEAAQITNKQTGIELKVHKRNNVNEGLEGANFTLKKYTDKTFTEVDGTFTGLTATSDKDGNVVFKDTQGNIVKLNTGYYIIEETKSPVGYKKAAASWKLQVKEENGSLVIIQKGPEHTATSFLSSNKAVAADNQTGSIKYKSIVKNIDPDSKTFVQRVYIDTRAYGKVVNVQITPKHKREEIDRAGKPPVTIKEGVKTAYRSTYQITNPPQNVDVDKVLNSYDLRDPNVTTVNTARWRPFDWGFDEDLLNLQPGVYYIDIEGYYDGSLIDKKVTNEVAIDGNFNFTQKDGKTPSKEPVLKDSYVRDDIKDEELGKLDLHIDFYDGARHLEQLTGFDAYGNPIYKTFHGASYQGGMITVRNGHYNYLRANGWGEKAATTEADAWANSKPAGQKYANALSKEAYLDGDKYIGAKIVPPLGTPAVEADTSLDISSLYTSDKAETVPQEGMSITNEREVYNITFSKHKMDGDDNTNRLEGAVFKLQKKEGSFWYDMDESYVSSAFNGYFGFRRLEPGTYRLVEVAPPKGYRALDGTLLEFVIKTIDPKGETFTKDGKTYDKESGLQVEVQPDGTHKVVDPQTGKIVESANGYVTIEYKRDNYLIPNVKDDETSTGKLVDFVTSATAKNIGKVRNEEPGKGSVTIRKVDENGDAIPGITNEQGELIAGAKFRATRLGAKTGEDGKPVADAEYTGIVGKDGTLKFEGLPLGNYELREIESPNGYINTGQVWHFTVGGKGLDPYAEDASPRTRNITSLIELTSSKMIVDRPAGDENTGNEEVQPHIGESLQFTNDYKIKDGVKISAGDYFTLKLTDNMDLYGIREDEPTNLDLFADGIGTIAKADYNGQAGTITYTFTKAAEQYTITDFKNVMATHINLYKVRNSGNQEVGMSIGNDTSKHKSIYVNYIVSTEYDNDGYNFINMASKIVSFNSKTGEFVHYFYINREGEYDGRNLTFRYKPNQTVNDLQITTYDLYYTDNASKIQSMPASFGVNENDRNLWRSGITQTKTVEANKTTTTNIGNFPNNRAAIVKVTGRIDTNDLTEFKGYSALYYGYNYQDDYGYTRWAEYPSVYRWDGVYVFENESTAQANFELKITNPSNKVIFEKVNTDGQVLKPTVDETGKVTKGAKFTLEKNDGTIENPSATWTAKTNPTLIDKDGRISYNNLDKGLYRLIENEAPEGYAKPGSPVAYLKVDESGKIYKKVTVPNAEGTGTTEIYQEVSETIPIKVVNNKPIEFVKVDADDNSKILPGAEFKVLYKEKETDNYKDYTLDGKVVTAKSDENGKFSIAVSKDGYYALKETTTPKGYLKLPDYIKEFKLENGKVQVLEKDPLKASLTKGANGMLTSEILEVDKDEGTFKQRLVLNPGHTQWTFDKYDTLLQLDVNNWNVNDQYRTIKVATLEKGKTVADLKDTDFREANPRNQQYSNNPLIYSIPSLYKADDYTQPNPKIANIVTEKGLVVEITGKITDKSTPVELNPEVYSRAFSRSIDKVSYKLDINNMSDGKGTYVDYDSKDPIQVENYKATFPHTGALGIFGFLIAGAIIMTTSYYKYRKKKRGRALS